MAWLPIDFKVPQYWKTAADGTNEYSGAVLKAYQVGTTTNIPFATTNEGTTTANSIALNADGFPEVGGNVVIPHLDQDYKLALYPDQSSADADSGAIWTVDDIDLIQTTDTATAADYNVWPLTDYGGAYFDGSNDYLTRGAGLTGASDGKKGTLVAFVTFDTAPATAQEFVLHGTGGKFIFRRDADGVFRIIAENSAGSTILNMATSSAYETSDTVYCVMASWDLATPGSNQLYVNDASDVATTTFTNDTIDYTVADWAVGADVSGSNKMTGNVLSVWFDQTDNLDFDTELNRRRFLDEQDNPVYLGREGELPTGTQPILFLGNHPNTSFETNRGSGGDFTENGTMAAASVTYDGQYDGEVSYGLPPGCIQMYGGSSEPSGWLFCSGQAVSRATYARLFSTLGTTFGNGDGSTTFNVPDLRDRFPLGENTMGASDAGRVSNSTTALADTGGTDTHTLTVSEIPTHRHKLMNQDGASPATGRTSTNKLTDDGVGGSADAYSLSGTSTDATVLETGASGSDGDHQNMPPFQVVNFIIKT